MRRNVYPIVIFTLITSLLSLSVYGQSGKPMSPKKKRKKALSYIEDGMWEHAKRLFLELIEDEPDNPEYNLYLGVAYLNSKIDSEKSLNYFKYVSPEEAEGVYYLKGLAFHYSEQFDSAIANYNKFKPFIKNNKSGRALMTRIDTLISQCNRAKDLYLKPRPGMFFDNLGTEVNTINLEYAPVVLEDLQTITFTGTNVGWPDISYMTNQVNAHEDIYYSTYDPVNQIWTARAKPDGTILNAEVDSDQNESSVTFTLDKKTFYFLRENDLWYSKNLGTPVKSNVNLGKFRSKKVVAIYINAQEDTRFLVSDMKGGKGGKDIYISHLKANGEWTEWENMEDINTEFDEDSPFLSKDGNKFYFSSYGHGSIGEADIFVATKGPDGHFINVQNMGVPINSPGNDIHFVLTGDNEEFGFMASDRMQNVGDMDVWRFWTCHDIKNTRIKGKLLAHNEPVAANIRLLGLDSHEIATTTPSELDGGYILNVQTEKEYILAVDVKDYYTQYFKIYVPKQCSEYDLYQSLNLELIKDQEGLVVEQRTTMQNAFFDVDKFRGNENVDDFVSDLEPGDPLYTPPVVDDKKISHEELVAQKAKAGKFKNAEFEFDKYDVTPSGMETVEAVADFLLKNPDYMVVFKGHTDSKGPESYNMGLSKRRAQAMARALAKKGVNKKRIAIEYYGETQLLVPDTDAQGNYLPGPAAKNRRVEVEIKPMEGN